MVDLHAVPAPDPGEVHDRFRAFEDAHQVMVHHARVGALVDTFSNDELHLLCEMDHLTIGDVWDLRRLGLLAPDEGWTGGPRKRTKRRTTPPREVPRDASKSAEFGRHFSERER